MTTYLGGLIQRPDGSSTEVSSAVDDAGGIAALHAIGLSDDDIAELRRQTSARARRGELRRGIARHAGDALTLLGSTADVAQILLEEIAALAAHLSEAQSLADVRAAAGPLVSLTASLRAGLADGTVVFAPSVKEGGKAEALREAVEMATQVSKQFVAAPPS